MTLVLCPDVSPDGLEPHVLRPDGISHPVDILAPAAS